MTLRKNQFDKAAIESGKWVEQFGVELKIASMANTQFIKEYATAKAEIEGDDVDNSALAKALAKAVLVDWKGVLDEYGEELPYSVEEATELLKENAPLITFVMTYTQNMDNYETELKQKKTKK